MPIDTQALMKQVGKIRILTSRLVDERMSGEYHSVFKGQGLEFDEVREYIAGDDARAIDWNVTARMGHPFVKRYEEERELTVLFAVDVSGSQGFGSGARGKGELAAELTCLLALSAIRNQDKVGLILFNDRIELCIRPRKGRTAVMRLVRETLAADETRRGTDIAGALRFLNRIQKKKAVVFLISDFMDEGYEKELRITARRHDVVCCPVSDPRECEWPAAGLIDLHNPETGERLQIDTSSPAVRAAFGARAAADTEALKTRFRKFGMDSVFLSTARPIADDILRLFRQRQIRIGRS
jgi:uncharacterized protein (DUF58 family)